MQSCCFWPLCEEKVSPISAMSSGMSLLLLACTGTRHISAHHCERPVARHSALHSLQKINDTINSERGNILK